MIATLLSHLVEALQLDLAIDRLPLLGVDSRPTATGFRFTIDLLGNGRPGVAGRAHLGGRGEQRFEIGTHEWDLLVICLLR
jgi:hypothetical protein